MVQALTTIDALVASVWQSYVAANELISQSCSVADASEQAVAESGESGGGFFINNEAGSPPASIPLALFHAPVLYYLSDLRLELCCYAVVRARLFGKRNFRHAKLHASVPKFWQRLFYVCHVYRLVIVAGIDKVETRFVAVTEEEFLRQVKIRAESVPHPVDWKFVLTEEQSRQLRVVPAVAAKPLYGKWTWGRLREKLSSSIERATGNAPRAWPQLSKKA